MLKGASAMADSSQSLKPHKDFPLTANKHVKQWCKKVRGKVWYFGPLRDPDAALARWNAEQDEILAGTTPKSRGAAGLTMGDLVNQFLTAKKRLIEAAELSMHTFNGYYKTCQRLIEAFGKGRLVSDLGPADCEELR